MTEEQARKKVEQLQKQNKELKEQVELNKKILTQEKDIFNMKQKANESAEQYYQRVREAEDLATEELRRELDAAKLRNDKIAAANALYELNKLNEELSARTGTLEEEIAQARAAALKLSGAELAAAEAQIVADETRLAQAQKDIALRQEEIDAQVARGVEMKKANKIDEEGKKASEKMFKSLAQKSLLFTTAQSGMVSEMQEFVEVLKNTDDPLGLITNGLGQFFNVKQLALSTVQKFVESTTAMVQALDEANASFAAATGLGDKFQGTMLNMRQEGNTMGVTFENAGTALKGLTENMVGFAHMSKAAQVDLGMTVAQFERIGIDANTSADFLNTFTLNMGMSEKQAMDLTKELALMGQSAGISAGKMTKDFQAAFKSLAVYGEQSIEVFQGLASAARAAGVEVATLTSLAGKFDTFSGAAETVGKLNALLGSTLSSTEMLMMTEDQRIETLVQQVQVGGTAFKDMNKFQQMAIANAAGISDMNEAQRIFGMNMKDYKKYRKDMERQEAVQEKFNKAVEATIPLQEKLKIFLAEFTVAVMPILEAVEFLVDGLVSLMKALGPTGTTVLFVVSALTLLGITMFAGIQVFRFMKAEMIKTNAVLAEQAALEAANNTAKKQSIFSTIAQTVKEKARNAIQKITSLFTTKDTVQNNVNTQSKVVNATATDNLTRSQTMNTAASGKAIPVMLALAGAILMIGGGIYLAATGMANFVAAFNGLNSDQLAAAQYALIGFAAGIIALGVALGLLIYSGVGPAAVPILLAIGATVAMIGGGIYLAATGMANLVSAFGDIAAMGSSVLIPLTAFMGSLALLMVAGPAGIAAAAGVMTTMAALTAGLYAVSLVMDDEGLQNGLENLALVTTGTSARSMTEAATGMAADLKTTVNAAMAQKIELVIKIKDGGLKEMVEKVIVNDLKSPAGGPIAKAVASVV